MYARSIPVLPNNRDSSMSTHVTIIPHTADLAIAITASSYEELICSAVQNMFASQKPIYRTKDLQVERTISVTGIDHESVLVALLNEALWIGATHHESYTHCAITKVSKTVCIATLVGKSIQRYTGTEIKAATYHALTIYKDIYGIWHATIVFDI